MIDINDNRVFSYVDGSASLLAGGLTGGPIDGSASLLAGGLTGGPTKGSASLFT